MDLAGTYQAAANRRETYSALARFDFDGDGKFAGRMHTNNDGNIREEELSGTYTMAETCVFEMKYCTAGRGTPCTATTLKGVVIDRATAAYVMILEPTAATVLGSLKLQ
jgi:hypothetical protein